MVSIAWYVLFSDYILEGLLLTQWEKHPVSISGPANISFVSRKNYLRETVPDSIYCFQYPLTKLNLSFGHWPLYLTYFIIFIVCSFNTLAFNKPNICCCIYPNLYKTLDSQCNFLFVICFSFEETIFHTQLISHQTSLFIPSTSPSSFIHRWGFGYSLMQFSPELKLCICSTP